METRLVCLVLTQPAISGLFGIEPGAFWWQAVVPLHHSSPTTRM